jgi:hypothetical protein
MCSSLRVTKNDPSNIEISNLISADFSGIGSKAMHGAILGSNLNMRIFLGEVDSDKMEEDRCDDHI